VTLSPGLRNAALLAHVVSSVGWLGAAVAFLGLAVTGVTSDSETTVRSVNLSMEVMVRVVIVPLALVGFATGLVSAVGTTWGLLRHYWVVIKLGTTLVATLVLLLYTEEARTAAALAKSARTTLDDLRFWPAVSHSVGGIILLLVAAVLGIFKPRGMTRRGRRELQRQRERNRGT
jgi:hypothetical protein